MYADDFAFLLAAIFVLGWAVCAIVRNHIGGD
jgi:hypothetical protein